MEQQSDGLKVMVIDDSKTIRRTAETLLKKVGCDVITAIDGFDALAKIADTHPNIIFVDIMMPRLDGYQTCALIKNNSAFKSTPVIMLFQGRPVRQGQGAHRRLRPVPHQAVQQGRAAGRDQGTRTQLHPGGRRFLISGRMAVDAYFVMGIPWLVF